MVELSGSIASIGSLTNPVDLVVDRCAVMVTHLTSTSNSPLHVRRMPGADTSNLTQTLVRLTRELLGAPPACHALESVAFGDGNAVDHLVLLEDGIDLNWFLEEAVRVFDFVSDGATVDLDLHKMSLLLLERCLADLGMCENADDCAVLLDAFEVAGDALAGILCMLLCVFCECLLLALVPVFVEPALELVGKMLSPHSSQRAEAAWCLDIANQANDHHLLECTDQRMPSMVLAPSLVPGEFR